MYLEWYLKEQAAGEKTLEETVVELLAEKGFHITTAESQALWSMLPEHRRY